MCVCVHRCVRKVSNYPISTIKASVTIVCVCYMWQSQVEIKHYSVVYFDCVTTFKVL